MDTSIRAQDFSPVSISTIGEDLTITGNVTSKGKLHLNGQVLGDVHCLALVLGENAQLEGNVVAEDVMVRGRLIGSVRAEGNVAIPGSRGRRALPQESFS
jgi:cytoskeletal protein CcmA (bactofilin family)